jgi:hypothetical protein
MAQAVIRRPVTAEARVRARVTHVGFVMDKVALGQVFLRVLWFSRQYHSIIALHTHIIWGMNNVPVSGNSSETWSHPIEISQ